MLRMPFHYSFTVERWCRDYLKSCRPFARVRSRPYSCSIFSRARPLTTVFFLTRAMATFLSLAICRRMRKKRKRVQSSTCRQISTLKAEADLKQRLLEDSEKKIIRYRMMARSYWERWDRELHERKEAIRKRKNQ